MSRTYRRVDRKMKLKNTYQECESSVSKNYEEADLDKLQTFFYGTIYSISSVQCSVPSKFKKMLNRRKRRRDNRFLYYSIKTEREDNMPSFKWYKDANYEFW